MVTSERPPACVRLEARNRACWRAARWPPDETVQPRRLLLWDAMRLEALRPRRSLRPSRRRSTRPFPRVRRGCTEGTTCSFPNFCSNQKTGRLAIPSSGITALMGACVGAHQAAENMVACGSATGPTISRTWRRPWFRRLWGESETCFTRLLVGASLGLRHHIRRHVSP
jgi:hypothetical protein